MPNIEDNDKFSRLAHKLTRNLLWDGSTLTHYWSDITSAIVKMGDVFKVVSLPELNTKLIYSIYKEYETAFKHLESA